MTSLGKLVTALFFLSLSTTLYAQISSDFATSADGWTAPNTTTFAYATTGGNPGGMVNASPFFFVGGSGTTYFPWWFVAPAKFLGNRNSYYNGMLRFDLQASSTAATLQTSEVQILNNAGIGLYYYPPTPFQPPAPGTWQTYSVSLSATTGYWKTTDSPIGTAATEAQIRAILVDLATLNIRGLFRNANVNVRLDNVILMPPIIINTQPSPQSICSGYTTTFTTAASNNPNITYRWQRETSPSVWTDLVDGGAYFNTGNSTLTVSTSGGVGAGNYRCRISGTAADDVFTSAASLSLIPLPSPPGAIGASSCTSGPLTLTATGAANGQYRWYFVPNGNGLISGETNSTYTTASLSTTTTYYVSINNGTCESTHTSVTASILSPPAAPTTTGASTCAGGTAILTASGGIAGQYRWYTVATGGTPIPGEVNATYTTPNLTVATSYYVSIHNGGCEGPRSTVTATIGTPPSAPTVIGASICPGATATLTASGGTAGQYRWYTVPTGGTPIANQNNATYTTPNLAATTTYYVAINNGACDGPRTAVTATVGLPTAPTATATSSCTPASLTITATGAVNGQYRWYTVLTGGTPIPGQLNNTYVTGVLSVTTTFYVSINIGGCESARTPVVASIADPSCNNRAPVVETTPSTTVIGGVIELDLADLITDADNNLDPSTLKIITLPASGADVVIQGLKLIINYTGISFVGSEDITIEVCDVIGACTKQTFEIDVVGDIEIFDAISPGNDGKNDVFFIENIDKLDETRTNHVTIYNRWGDLVWEGNNYNNASVAFKGKSKNDGELPSGTYFYKIEFKGVKKKKTVTGALTLKR